MLENLEFYARVTLNLARQKRVRRDDAFVGHAYDEHWRGYARHLERAASLDQWLSIPGLDRCSSYYNDDGRLALQEFDSVSFYRSVIQDAIRRHFPGARSIAEFGCGVGRNVLALQRSFEGVSGYGYELSPEGVEIATQAAQKFSVGVRYAQLDYLRDGDDKFVFPDTDVAFTSFSLEQVPHGAEKALRRILQRVRLGTVHIEPVAENYPFNLRGVLGRIYSWRNDYLKDFSQVVTSLPVVRVTKRVLATSHNALMYPTLYVLEKDATAVAAPTP